MKTFHRQFEKKKKGITIGLHFSLLFLHVFVDINFLPTAQLIFSLAKRLAETKYKFE